MKFTIAGSRIICSRKDGTRTEGDGYKRVVEFDTHVESVPPHVAARLARREIEELEAFLADRQRIRANPSDKNMLEALPGLLDDATDILESVDQVNETVYSALETSVAALCTAMARVKPARGDELTRVDNMLGSEAQKERLEHIKQEM